MALARCIFATPVSAGRGFRIAARGLVTLCSHLIRLGLPWDLPVKGSKRVPCTWRVASSTPHMTQPRARRSSAAGVGQGREAAADVGRLVELALELDAALLARQAQQGVQSVEQGRGVHPFPYGDITPRALKSA